MPHSNTARLKDFHLRAAAPKYLRAAAIGLLAVAVVAVLIGFFRNAGDPEFRMKGFPTSLSKDVVASIENYERRETEGDKVRYYIKADRAQTFSDNHQELENVFLQVFDDSGTLSDRMTASKAVYVPGENQTFTAYFAGNVRIETRDSLQVLTENLTYEHASQTATAEELVNFERANLRGSSIGAKVNAGEKRVELLNKVDIESVKAETEAPDQFGPARMTSDFASYDQNIEQIELKGSVHVVTNPSQASDSSSDVRSGNAKVVLSGNAETDLSVAKVELFDSVQIETRKGQGPASTISGGYALYDRTADRFEVRNSARIVTVAGERPTAANASNATYLQSAGKVSLSGSAEVSQGSDLVRGGNIDAELYPSKKLKFAVAKGDAYLKQVTAERTTEVSGNELNAAYDESDSITAANSVGGAGAVLTPVNAAGYTKVSVNAPKAIKVAFRPGGLIERIVTQGRTTINLDAPNNGSDAANKRITADEVRTVFDNEGKFLVKAEAIGNAELFIDPLKAAPENYKTTVTAPKFECDFHPVGNAAKSCTGATNANAVRVPTVDRPGRGRQTMTSARLVATFNQQTKDLETLEASGDAKFVELDRNTTAGKFTYTAIDEVVRLRGGEPTAWDSRARAKAPEIDWDTRNQRSYLRGGVSTTYYSQKQTGGSAPFSESGKPVFVTAANAEFDHQAETALYTGNSRAWQESNYVRSNSLLIRQKEGQMFAEGDVQSLLTDVKRKEGGRESKVPVYASASKMNYNRDTRVLRYENSVDIRQGTDRLSGALANIYMDERNEIVRTEVENGVTITQPGRTATGTFARYTAADESVLLRGEPARINDVRNGSSQGAEVVFYLRENRVTGTGTSAKDPSGRVRSVYKIKNN